MRSFHLNTCLVPIMIVMIDGCSPAGEEVNELTLRGAVEDLKLQAGYLVGFQPCVLMIITYNNNNPEIRWTFHHSNPSITGIPIFSRRHMSWKHLDVTSSGKKRAKIKWSRGIFISKQILSFFPSNTVDTPHQKPPNRLVLFKVKGIMF